MGLLRSGLWVGQEDSFEVTSAPSCVEGATVLTFWMRLLPYKEIGGYRNVQYPRYTAIPAHVSGIVGDGETIEKAGSDACLKIIYYIERALANGEDPMREDCQDLANLHAYGKLTIEQNADENEVEILGSATDCDIYAYVIEGKVVVIEWLENGVFHVWRN